MRSRWVAHGQRPELLRWRILRRRELKVLPSLQRPHGYSVTVKAGHSKMVTPKGKYADFRIIGVEAADTETSLVIGALARGSARPCSLWE